MLRNAKLQANRMVISLRVPALQQSGDAGLVDWHKAGQQVGVGWHAALGGLALPLPLLQQDGSKQVMRHGWVGLG